MVSLTQMQRIQFGNCISQVWLVFLLILFFASCLSSSADIEEDGPNTQKELVVVGGGEPKQEIRMSLLDLSSASEPNVLIIPHAARESNRESSGQRNVEIFEDMGVEQITVLNLDYVDKALADIAASDIIWMSGGSQSRLMSTLEERAQGAVISAIREKYESGTPIGGSSAGAAVMSEVMISSGYLDEDTGLLTPRISEGLALWPEVIVDQHFSERDRLERLEIAIQKHPDLTGLGIDERTAVLYDGQQDHFRVMGEGTVTILRATDAGTELEKTVLGAGDSYQFSNNLESELRNK